MDQNPEEQANIRRVTSVSAKHKTEECVLNNSENFNFLSLDRKSNTKRRPIKYNVGGWSYQQKHPKCCILLCKIVVILQCNFGPERRFFMQ